ncbi:unnamed protein product [Adineta steineri]|uniref:Apple domain-containing protein n=1 Tax=Adineta steineri TaxID=433720 RepID=A0A818GRP9_9BILA|nr:unnamed protein product [Adineta steineri]CAF3494585.1 unnamed protein product [Adineta steineri]
MNNKYFIVVILLNLIIEITLSSSNSASRTSNGILYPHKRFIPSENRFYLGVHKCRNRLRCINLCQESSLCQTIMYNQIKQECTLFSEHVEYGSGRLYDENNENLITIRLDKDSFKDIHKTIKTKKNPSVIVSSRHQKYDKNICENCEL